MNHQSRVLLIALLAVAATVANALLHYDRGSLIYDEGDYYQAIRNGFMANWYDNDDVSTVQFFTVGFQAISGTIERSEMSKMIRSSGSSAFYRHYHPPFAFYPPMITRAIYPSMDEENQLRLGSFVLMIAWIVLLALLSLRHRDLFSPWMLLVPSSANWIASACAFNMHVPFGLSLTLAMLCWYAYENDRSSVWLRRLTLVALAVAISSVEYSLFLIGGLTLYGLLDLWRRRSAWRQVARCRAIDAAWLAGTLLLLWPAGVLKLGLLKSYALQAYIALFRLSDDPGGYGSFAEMIEMKWTGSPLELVLLIAIIVGVAIKWRELIRRGSLFVSMIVITAICYTQLNPVLVLRWYLFPVFCLVFTLYARILADRLGWSMNRQTLVAVGLAIVIFIVAQFDIQLSSYTMAREVRAAVIEHSAPGTPIIAEQGIAPPMGAYFSDRVVKGYHPWDLKNEDVRDSIIRWADDHVIIMTEEIPLELPEVERVGKYVIYGGGNGKGSRE